MLENFFFLRFNIVSGLCFRCPVSLRSPSAKWFPHNHLNASAIMFRLLGSEVQHIIYWWAINIHYRRLFFRWNGKKHRTWAITHFYKKVRCEISKDAVFRFWNMLRIRSGRYPSILIPWMNSRSFQFISTFYHIWELCSSGGACNNWQKKATDLETKTSLRCRLWRIVVSAICRYGSPSY